MLTNEMESKSLCNAGECNEESQVSQMSYLTSGKQH